MKKLKEPDGKKLFVPEFKLTQIDKIEWSEIPIIMDSKMSVQVLRDYITYKQLDNQINVNEFAFVIYLNRRNKVVAITHHTTGGIDGTIMDLRLIFAQSLLVGASSLILFHNHPTGNLQPSDGDRRVAQKIAQAGKIMEIQVVDFIIITSNSGYTSFLDDGISLSYSEGGYMAKGGVTGYERLVKKVAANYEGKAVPSKYQSKYGKRYDADEAKKVGYAVATKVYGKPMARMAEGGETDSEITAEDRMIAQQHNYKLDL